jgi:hypothetical protein
MRNSKKKQRNDNLEANQNRYQEILKAKCWTKTIKETYQPSYQGSSELYIVPRIQNDQNEARTTLIVSIEIKPLKFR